MPSTKVVALKPIDRDVLARCVELIERHGADGIFPRGAQHKQFKRLKRNGLLRFVTYGRCIDSGDEREDHPIYTITAAGRAALARGGA